MQILASGRQGLGLGFDATKPGYRNAIPGEEKEKPWFQIFVAAFQIEGTTCLFKFRSDGAVIFSYSLHPQIQGNQAIL